MQNSGPSVVKRERLSEEELAEARKLAGICNQYEKLDYLTPYVDQQSFLYYKNGSLVGFLNLFPAEEIEVYAIVHPENRRNGIGRALLDAAKKECKRRGISSCLLVCEEASTSGRAFVETMGGAQYRFSEYRMKLEPEQVPKHQPHLDQVELHLADTGDVELLARLTAAAYSNRKEEHLQRYAHDILKPSHRFYIAKLHGEPIGSLGIAIHDRRVYIIAFGVLPVYRGRGYGRHMLAETIGILLAENWQEILIEVVTENQNALSLYRSCGFRETTSYRYYSLKL